MSPEMQLLQKPELGECDLGYLEGSEFEELEKAGCFQTYALADQKRREPQRARQRQDAIDILRLKLQVNALARRVKELEAAPQSLTVPINTFAPKPLDIMRPIMVLVEPVVDEEGEPCEYIATFPDGAISVTGDTVEGAVLLLKDRMAAQYSRLTRVSANRLGKIPRQQLDALQAVMRRIE